MGSLAESMGISTSMAMWIAVAQLPVMMGLVLHYPTVRIDIFSTGFNQSLSLSLSFAKKNTHVAHVRLLHT